MALTASEELELLRLKKRKSLSQQQGFTETQSQQLFKEPDSVYSGMSTEQKESIADSVDLGEASRQEANIAYIADKTGFDRDFIESDPEGFSQAIGGTGNNLQDFNSRKQGFKLVEDFSIGNLTKSIARGGTGAILGAGQALTTQVKTATLAAIESVKEGISGRDIQAIEAAGGRKQLVADLKRVREISGDNISFGDLKKETREVQFKKKATKAERQEALALFSKWKDISRAPIERIEEAVFAPAERGPGAPVTLKRFFEDFEAAFEEDRQTLRKKFDVSPEFAGSFSGQLAEGLGQLGVQVGTTIVSPTTAVTMIQGQIFQGAVDDYYQTTGISPQEATSDQKQEAFAVGMSNAIASTALEAGPIGVITGKIFKAGKLTAREALSRISASGAIEGLTESAQGFIQDLIASGTFDEDRELYTEEAFRQRITEFAVGAVLGAGVSGAFAAPQIEFRKQDVPITEGEWSKARENYTDEDIKNSNIADDKQDMFIEAMNGDKNAQQEIVTPTEIDPTEGVQAAIDDTGKVDFEQVPIRTPEQANQVQSELTTEETLKVPSDERAFEAQVNDQPQGIVEGINETRDREILAKEEAETKQEQEVEFIESQIREQIQEIAQEDAIQAEADRRFLERKERKRVTSKDRETPEYQDIQEGVIAEGVEIDEAAVEEQVARRRLDTIEVQNKRNIRKTVEFKSWQNYTENDLNDISKPFLHRKMTMTAERAAEQVDGEMGGRTFREMVLPVYQGAESIAREVNELYPAIRKHKVIEGTKADRDTSLLAQGKGGTKDGNPELAKMARAIYDDLLDRMNIELQAVGKDPIPKRENYVTHLAELDVLSDIFGGLNKVQDRRLEILQERIQRENPEWSADRVKRAARRQIGEPTTGIEAYINPNSPVFQYAKERLGEFEANPSIIRSLKAYIPSSLRVIHQTRNVSKINAFSEELPPNARQFFLQWNAEQVAGVQASTLFKNPTVRRGVNLLRNTIGQNTILGNLATTAIQLTSFPPVVAMAGMRNTVHGYATNIGNLISGRQGKFAASRTKLLRDLSQDIGLGQSVIDESIKLFEKHEGARDRAAKARAAMNLGRKMAATLMEASDKFTVGATFEAFYKQGTDQGMSPDKAFEFAEKMTGKTQALYFQEAVPPFLNTFEGRIIGQFGTFSANQWEFFKSDLGKDLGLDPASKKDAQVFMGQFLRFLLAAYLADMLSEYLFGRQPYDLKEFIDESVDYATGDSDFSTWANTATSSISTYVPYLSGVKFDSLPPVIEFGKDMLNLTLGKEENKKQAIRKMDNWSFNILLPFGGNQVRKSLEGADTIVDADIPFIQNAAETRSGMTRFEVEGADQLRAILFGPWATLEAQKYFKEKKEKKKRQTTTGGTTRRRTIDRRRRTDRDR